MKVMITYPPLKGRGSPMLTQNRQFQWFKEPSYIYPMVPASAATLLEENGFKILWNDCIAEKWSYEQFLSYIKKEKPDLIAIETKTPVINQHWQIIDELKSEIKEASLVLMGDHVTALPEESMNNCKVDFVIRGGNYDLSLLSIANYISRKDKLIEGIWYREGGGINNTGEFKSDMDLDSLPYVDRNLTKAHLYGEKWKKRTPFFYTMAGRDCWWGKCSFCSWTTLFPKFNGRSVESLLDEIGMLIDKHGAKEIFDDTGTFPTGNWLNQFCEGMISRSYNKKILFSCNMRFGCINESTASLMKKAGFRKLKMGLESANQATLDRLNKKMEIKKVLEECKIISKEKIDIHLTVMVGYPWESREEINETLRFARNLMNKGYIEMLQATTIVPYPGTPLYDMAIDNKWFRFNPINYDRYDMGEPVLKTPDISPEEIKDMCSQLYKSFWNPQFILKQLMKIRTIDDLKYVSRGAKAVLGHIADFK